ncbi:hypothetical protein ACPYOC_07385 [Ornithinimicrobium sp. W1665]|uniref:hypothetical protein n=1 Tax=Ornithinimicrobium sp. W1665 TaxID=3416666 RepID=UPI003CFB8FEC
MAGQTITVSVLADTKPLSKAFNNLSNEMGLGKIGKAVGALGKAVAVGATAAGAGFAALTVAGVKAASGLEQSMGGVDAVFKQTADEVHALAKGADMDLGLTQNAYNELATVIGTSLKNSGTPMKELAGTTDELISRSSDLAATFGGTVVDASNAMASALRGEFEPLRQYGVSLNQADINARALADSGKANVAELTKQEKALATQALIMEQSADAAGMFAAENDTLAGKMERAKAVAGNLAAEFGAVFLPAATAAMGYLLEQGVPAIQALGTWAQDHLLPALQSLGAWFTNEGVPRLQEFGAFLTETVVPKIQEFGNFLTGTVVPALASFGTWVQNNAAWLLPLTGAILGAVAGFKAFTIAMAAWRVITTAAAAAQLLLNAALLANPIGLVIALVAGLVAGFLILWNTNDGFRDAVINAWQAITAGVQAAWAWLQTLPSKFSDMMTSIRTAVSTGIDAVVTFFQNLPGRAQDAASALTSRLSDLATTAMTATRTAVSDGIDRVLGFFRNMPGRIVSALGNLSGLLTGAAADVIDGFLGGLRGGFDRVRGELGRLTNLLPDWKGPASKDRSILRGAGQLIIDGFVRGLEDRFGDVRSTLGGLTDEVASTSFESPSIDAPPRLRTASDRTSSTPGNGGSAPVVQLSADAERVLLAAVDRPIQVGLQVSQREFAKAVVESRSYWDRRGGFQHA